MAPDVPEGPRPDLLELLARLRHLFAPEALHLVDDARRLGCGLGADHPVRVTDHGVRAQRALLACRLISVTLMRSSSMGLAARTSAGRAVHVSPSPPGSRCTIPSRMDTTTPTRFRAVSSTTAPVWGISARCMRLPHLP